MTAQYLSLLDVSDHSGVRFETLKSLVRRGKFPEPDAIIGLGGTSEVRARMEAHDDRHLAAWLRTPGTTKPRRERLTCQIEQPPPPGRVDHSVGRGRCDIRVKQFQANVTPATRGFSLRRDARRQPAPHSRLRPPDLVRDRIVAQAGVPELARAMTQCVALVGRCVIVEVARLQFWRRHDGELR